MYVSWITHSGRRALSVMHVWLLPYSILSKSDKLLQGIYH